MHSADTAGSRAGERGLGGAMLQTHNSSGKQRDGQMCEFTFKVDESL